MSYQFGYAFFDRHTLAPTSDIFDETYFKINLIESGFTTENNRNEFSIGSKIGTIDCADWPLADQDEINFVLLQKSKCIDASKVVFSGTRLQGKYKGMHFGVERC